MIKPIFLNIKLIHFVFKVEQATDHLLNLSPFELKTLLHMIISGNELGSTQGKFKSDFRSLAEFLI